MGLVQHALKGLNACLWSSLCYCVFTASVLTVFVGLTGQQWDGDIKWTPFCNGWDSGPETAARGQRWFPTSTETVQFPATVRHPSFLFFLSSNCPCIHAAASTPLTYHVLPALSQPLHLTFFLISINFFSSHFCLPPPPPSPTYLFGFPQSQSPQSHFQLISRHLNDS